MAIFNGEWQPDGQPAFIPGTAACQGGSHGSTARTSPLRPIEKPTNLRRDVMWDFGYVARYWKENLTPAQKLRWYQADRNLTNRNREVQSLPTFEFWMQTQFPLCHFDMGMEPPATQSWMYDIIDLQLLSAVAATQLITVYWGIGREPESNCRSVMHVHQVPLDYVDTPRDCRMAKWATSWELHTDILKPNHGSQSQGFQAIYPFNVGDNVGVYIRITHLKDPAPPGAEISHYLTTEPQDNLSTIAV